VLFPGFRTDSKGSQSNLVAAIVLVIYLEENTADRKLAAISQIDADAEVMFVCNRFGKKAAAKFFALPVQQINAENMCSLVGNQLKYEMPLGLLEFRTYDVDDMFWPEIVALLNQAIGKIGVRHISGLAIALCPASRG